MPNRVDFYSYNPLETLMSYTEVKDVIDSLFRGESNFSIYGSMRHDRKNRPTLGLHVSGVLFSGHEIYLAPHKIKACFERGSTCGGNRKAPNLKIAMGMVLAHEIQHANQSLIHEDHPSSFYGKERSRYRTRPCEREARSAADESIPILAGIFNIELFKEKIEEVPQDELYLIAECLAEADEISTKDIVEELRFSGLNNGINVMKIKSLLSQWDVSIQ